MLLILAEEKEKYKLCARIVEVRNLIDRLYNKKKVVERVFSPMVSVVFTTLVIRVDSIKKVYGDFEEFVDKNNLWGQTNNKLYVLAEMNYPAYHLNKIMENTLIPLGLKEGIDYCYLSEQMIQKYDSE